MKSNEIVSINPSTGEELGRRAPMQREEIEEAVAAAARAFLGWSQVPIRKRQKYLKRLYHLILKEKDEIARLIALEQGKPVPEALAAEITAVLGIVKTLSRTAHHVVKSRRAAHRLVLLAHKQSRYHFIPFGVIAVISPWNFPFSVALPQIAGALVTGNTVVFKPASSTFLVGRKIEKLFEAAGFPEGVLNTVFAGGRDASIIVKHPQVDKVFFTGSTDVGRRIMTAAAKGVTPVVLELGGNDPAIIARDANVARAARGVVWGAFFNTGQACAAVERAYVERPVADRFIEACVEEASRLKVGDPLEEGTDIGPLSNAGQLSTVRAQVRDAVKKGARVLVGGKRRGDKGLFFEPTVLSDVDHTMKVMNDETFGPVLPIMVVDSLDEAIRLANDSPYGLSAYGWTESRAVADRLMNELESGTVLINDCACTWGEPNAPWGGLKCSGIGRTHSRFGLREMVQLKYTSYDDGCGAYNPWWFNYDNLTKRLLGDAAHLLFDNNPFKRMSALASMMKNRRFLETVRWGAVVKNFYKIF